MRRESTSNLYATSDLSLASALSLYFPLWAVDKDNPNKKAEFVFKREPGLDELVEAFWRRQLQVEPLTYFQALKAIKSQLYENK